MATVLGIKMAVGNSRLIWRKLGVYIAIYKVDEDEDEVVLLRLYYVSSSWRSNALIEQ